MSFRLPENLLFDLDGTLLDSLPGIAFSVDAAIAAEGLAPRRRDLRELIGPPIRGIMSRALGTEDEALLDRLEKHFRASYDTEGWQKTPCFPGAQDVLRQMRRVGHRLFVVSNKPRHIAVRILESEGVLELFEQIVTKDSRLPVYVSKPEMIAELLRSQQFNASAAMMIGDTMEDASAASKHNMSFAYLEHGYGEVSAEHPVKLRLKCFADFVPYLTPGETAGEQ